MTELSKTLKKGDEPPANPEATERLKQRWRLRIMSNVGGNYRK